jgi:hypothetical protein
VAIAVAIAVSGPEVDVWCLWAFGGCLELEAAGLGCWLGGIVWFVSIVFVLRSGQLSL